MLLIQNYYFDIFMGPSLDPALPILSFKPKNYYWCNLPYTPGLGKYGHF
jgi:hypothetical protein